MNFGNNQIVDGRFWENILNNYKRIVLESITSEAISRATILQNIQSDSMNYPFQTALVPEVGLEPTQYYHRGILSPVRLPISPPRHSYAM